MSRSAAHPAGGLAGVVLAAGLGTRLRPLTDLRPKPLCPVGARPLIDHCLELLSPHCGDGPEHLAVNAFHLSDQVVAHLGGRTEISVEPTLLGTAGGLAALARWRAGRNVLLLNGDAYLSSPDGPAAIAGALIEGWAGHSVRMLVVPTDSSPDFTDASGRWRYVGACLMPDDLVRDLRSEPSGLHARVWQPAQAAGRLELIPFDGVAIDTGTPTGYLAANLHASGGRSVIGVGARVLGTVTQSVVWPDAFVAEHEALQHTIRAGTPGSPITVTVSLPSVTAGCAYWSK